MEISSISEVRYDKEGHGFVLVLEDGMAIVYDTTNSTHAVRVVETDTLDEET